MLIFLLNIVFALLSVACYVWAPEAYTWEFCTMLLGVYLVQNICWMVLNGKKRRLGFEVFFMLSFLFVNFIYPVFYAELFPHWHFFQRAFNRHVINQATALAYMAYSFYMVGITDWPWEQRPEPTAPTYSVRPAYLLCIALISFISFGLYVAFGGYAALTNVYSGGGNLRDVGIFSYFNNLFSISALLLAALLFRLPSRWHLPFLALLAVFILLLLSTGSRQLSISIILILMVSFSLHIYRLRAWQVGLLVTLGAVVLFFVMLLREQTNSEGMENALASFRMVSPLDVASDLTINNINLYVLVDWGNTHHLTWFHGVLVDLCSPIPKLGTWLINYYDEAPELLNGGDLPSYILLGRNAGWGTGTNMVGELYRSFGAVGTCLFMTGLGRLLRESYYRANNSIYWYAFFMLMVGHTVMYPRASFIYDPRTIVWAMLLLWLVKHGVDRYYRVFGKEKAV